MAVVDRRKQAAGSFGSSGESHCTRAGPCYAVGVMAAFSSSLRLLSQLNGNTPWSQVETQAQPPPL